MADIYTGTANVSVNVSGDYAQAFLAFLTQKQFFYVGFGKKGGDMDLARNSGTTKTWDRPELLPVATTPLPEYETPNPLGVFSTTPVTATIVWYGDHLNHSDRMVRVALNKKLLSQMRAVQVLQYKKTMDTLSRDVLVAGDNVQYTDGSSRAEVATAVADADVNGVVNDLWRNEVPFITKRITPSQLVSTVGLEEAYFAIGHIDLDKDVRALAGFQSVITYAQPSAAQPGEIGKTGKVRWILTSNGKIWAGAGADVTGTYRNNNDDGDGTGHGDVYGIVIFGDEAYGEMLLAGKGFEYIVHAPGEAGSTDPHDSRGSAAWHQAATYKILEQARIWRIECLCTDV